MPHRTRSRVIFLTLALSVLLFAVVGTPSASAAEPGVVPDITWGSSRPEIDKEIALMQAAGVKWVRAAVPWNAIEPDVKGTYNTAYLSDIDYAIGKARGAGIQVIIPVQDGVPYWASADPHKSTSPDGTRNYAKTYHPTNYQDYADFFRFVVNRYKGEGIHAYEVWNEPNLARFWASGVSAAEYTQMLKAAYPAIKQADPSSTVVLGGLSGNDRAYLQQVYDNGGKGYFDAAGIHDYAWGDPTKCWTDSTGHKAKDAFCGIEEVRQVMVDHGDADKSIWITEMGWSTCNNAASDCWNSGVTEAQQADYTTKAFHLLDEKYPWVKIALAYNFRNNSWQHDDGNSWEAQTGLVSTNFTPKPAYAAFKAYALSRSASPSAPGTPTSDAMPVSSATPQRALPAPGPNARHARQTRTTLRVFSRPSVAKASTPLRQAPHFAAVIGGRVYNATSRRVVLRFQSYRAATHRWVTVALRVVRLSSNGAFSLPLGHAAGQGRWRVRGEYRGGPSATSSLSRFAALRTLTL